MPSPSAYLKKVSALCARPDLSDPQDQIDFYRRLIAYWTRQLSLHSQGKAVPFAPLEIDEILDELESRILSIQQARSTSDE